MSSNDRQLCCPHCFGSLAFLASDCPCLDCGRKYSMVLGIADLRVPIRDAWIDFEEDRRVAATLAEHFETDTFEDLVRRVWESRRNITPEILNRRIREIREG